MTEIKVGQKLRSVVCFTEIVVVRLPSAAAEVTCGGHAMVPAGPAGPDAHESKGAPDPDSVGGTLLGKRYADEELGLEVLCTKPGDGSLGVNGRALPEKSAKPLPSSD